MFRASHPRTAARQNRDQPAWPGSQAWANAAMTTPDIIAARATRTSPRGDRIGTSVLSFQKSSNHLAPFFTEASDRISTSGVAIRISQWCQVTPHHSHSAQ
jgi:hypothetical protein